MKNLYRLLGIIVVAAAFTLALVACKTDGWELEDLSGIHYYVSQKGGADYNADTTGIIFTFKSSIDDFAVSINDITVGGDASIGTAKFTGSGKDWTLAPITVSSAGRASVTINKTGIHKRQKYFTVYKEGQNIPPNGTSAKTLVAGIKVGWNLGNTLDAFNLGYLGKDPSLDELETAWVKTKTSQANIDALSTAGFNAIRIPVSWHKVANPNDNYKIREDWMTRVKEIVNYAVSKNMYIILNTHHDESIFKFQNADMAKSIFAFENIWEQIAEAFKDYDEKLIFEALNEPRTKDSPNEWMGGTPAERSNLNIYYQYFIDVVRESAGDNNYKRILMINTYGASGEQPAMSDLKLPNDNIKNKIIVSYHAYTPYNFALNQGSGATAAWSKSNSSDTSAITSHINRAESTFINKGIPVIIGEFGAVNRNNNTSARAAWAEYYTAQARAKGIPCFWWDNAATTGDGELFGLLDRSTNTFVYQQIVTGLMNGSK
jgi:endoglucanase